MKFEQLQKLYKVSASTGKTQVWFGWVEDNEVKCSYGELDGKMQVNTYTAEAKNIGRVNETTPSEQAEVELQAMYDHQVTNKHYHLTEEQAIEAVNVCREPRKITNYKDRYTKMSSILLTTVKLNGSRACVINGQMYSKIGRPEEIKVDHLRIAVEKLNDHGLANFDAEVYADGLSLQRIRSAWLKPVKTDKEVIKVAKDRIKRVNDIDPKTIKTSEQAIDYLGYNPNEDAPKLKFHIFDIPMPDNTTYEERVPMVRGLIQTTVDLGIHECFGFLLPQETHSHVERMKLLDKVVAEGNEGLVHYEPLGIYEFGKRSTNTAKSKLRYDSEALVTGVEMCKNGEGKLFLRACDALENVTFKAMMKGTHESRMYEVQEQFIGQWVTFEYEELSDIGVPTKPSVRETRLCDDKGQPLA